MNRQVKSKQNKNTTHRQDTLLWRHGAQYEHMADSMHIYIYYTCISIIYTTTVLVIVQVGARYHIENKKKNNSLPKHSIFSLLILQLLQVLQCNASINAVLVLHGWFVV